MQLPKPILMLALLCQLVASVESQDTDLEFKCGSSNISMKRKEMQISMDRVARRSHTYFNECGITQLILSCSLEDAMVKRYDGPDFTAPSGSILLKTPVKVNHALRNFKGEILLFDNTSIEWKEILTLKGLTWVVLSCNKLTCEFKGVIRKTYVDMKYRTCDGISRVKAGPNSPTTHV
ncbi:hypothetical protein BGT96224_AcSP31269 [Blumeria graminis f. sp. tritici 96224]|nr:hypothetical protein BGT96224_AcSP31269 [Blumeria graminis f. sp. tritici 96224]